MHIDRHYGMLDCFYDEDLLPLRNNPHMPYNEFKKKVLARSMMFLDGTTTSWPLIPYNQIGFTQIYF